MRDDTTDQTRGTSGHSRRSFLTTSAALAGGAALFGMAGTPRSARSAPVRPTVGAGTVRPPKAGEPINMAVIGPGGMGNGHCHAFTSFARDGRANVRIVALADVNDLHAERSQKVIEERQGSGTCDTTRDYRDILKRDDVHAVLVASPEHWHAQHAMDALIAGKDVYCEKPMTLRLDEALDLRKVVLDHPDRIFQVGTQKMILPKYVNARKAIKEGKIGTPLWSQTSYCRNTPDGEWNYYGVDENWKPGVNLDWDTWCGHLGPRTWDPKVYIRWRRYRDFSTGIIGDLLVHEMTPMIHALDQGWPVHVQANGSHMIDHDMENHDQVFLNVKFEDGHTMIVAGATNNEVGLETMIRGDRANMYLGSRDCTIRPERAYVDEVDAETIRSEDIGNDQDQLRLNWLECIRSREPAVSNIDLASKVMVAVDLATRSIWDGHGYTFDPETMKAARV